MQSGIQRATAELQQQLNAALEASDRSQQAESAARRDTEALERELKTAQDRADAAEGSLHGLSEQLSSMKTEINGSLSKTAAQERLLTARDDEIASLRADLDSMRQQLADARQRALQHSEATSKLHQLKQTSRHAQESKEQALQAEAGRRRELEEEV